MAEEVEKKEEVTVKTPEETKETTEETVVEQPADTPKEEPKPTQRRSRRMKYQLTPWQRVQLGDARAQVHREDKGSLDQNLVDRYNTGEGHAQLTEEQQKEALANKKEGAARFDANTTQGVEDKTITPPADISGSHFEPKSDTTPTENNPETAPAANTPQGTEGSSALEGRDAEGVTEEPENQEPQGEEQPTEAGSEENAEEIAKEVEGVSPNEIPTDPDDFQEWVQSKPELKQFYDFMINDSDAKLKASRRRQRREQMGVALGNLMRAFVNLGTTMHGGLNSYNHESADKIRKEAGEQEEKWRKELNDARKERWEQYQNLRNQYFQEKQQAHKEAMDTENLKLAKEKNAREVLKNDAQLQLIYAQASKAQQEAILKAIDAGDEAELNRLKREEIKSRTRKNDTSAANNTRRTNIAERNQESLESLRKTQEGVNRAREQNLLEGGNDDNPYGGGSSIGW